MGAGTIGAIIITLFING